MESTPFANMTEKKASHLTFTFLVRSVGNCWETGDAPYGRELMSLKVTCCPILPVALLSISLIKLGNSLVVGNWKKSRINMQNSSRMVFFNE